MIKSIRVIITLLVLALLVVLFSSCEKEDVKDLDSCNCKTAVYINIHDGRHKTFEVEEVNKSNCRPVKDVIDEVYVFKKCNTGKPNF